MEIFHGNIKFVLHHLESVCEAHVRASVRPLLLNALTKKVEDNFAICSLNDMDMKCLSRIPEKSI